jgi:hypothetical protein
MKIRLTRKFAEFLNGIDLTQRRVGEVVEVPRHEAEMLLAEEWAVPASDPEPRAKADDAPRRTRKPKAD